MSSKTDNFEEFVGPEEFEEDNISLEELFADSEDGELDDLFESNTVEVDQSQFEDSDTSLDELFGIGDNEDK